MANQTYYPAHEWWKEDLEDDFQLMINPLLDDLGRRIKLVDLSSYILGNLTIYTDDYYQYAMRLYELTEKRRIYQMGYYLMQSSSNETESCPTDNNTREEKDNNKESTYVDKKKTKSEEEITNEDYRKFRIWMNENCPYCNNPRNMPSSTITQSEFLKLKSEYSGRDIAETILEIENRKDLRKKYANLYRTTLNWLKNRNK